MAAREVTSRDDMRHGGDPAGAAGTARLLRRRRGWLWTGLAALAGFTVYAIIAVSYLDSYAPGAPRAACAAAVPFLLAVAVCGLAAAAADTVRLRRADPGSRAAALAAADLFPLTAHPYYGRPGHRASWCCGQLARRVEHRGDAQRSEDEQAAAPAGPVRGLAVVRMRR